MLALGQETQASHHHPLPPAQLEKLGVRALNGYDLELECLMWGETLGAQVLPGWNFEARFLEMPEPLQLVRMGFRHNTES